MEIPRLIPAALGFALAVFASAPARAVILAENPLPSVTVLNTNVGQSFTVLGAGNYNGIVFNFYNANGAAYAPGTGFLLSQAYAGTPANLNNLTPGYIGQATGAGGAYTFASNLTLTAGTQYFLYTQAIPLSEGFAATTLDAYAGGGAYTITGSNFAILANVDYNFSVTGNRVVTPPSTNAPDGGSMFALLGLALLGLAALRRMVRV